ncbi:MAG: M28 family peptidase [Solirubrobacterales bacterium]|nr:M28 family peptidase [Solirubrobacterales bacterium]
MQTPPTCMWLAELSLVRNEVSSALSRSMCPWLMRLSYPRMVRLATVALALALALTIGPGCGGSDAGPDETTVPPVADGFDAERAFADLRAQVALGPRPSGSGAARQASAAIAKRLRRAGVEGVRIQRPYANVVARLPGSTPGAVVLGAHYDTKDAIPRFVGANDGASGVAILLELARSLPRPLPGPSVELAFFDAEEARGDRPFEVDGTRGSRQYVELARAGGEQGSPPIGEVAAMVLFDMVGDCDLRIPLEANSDPGIYELFAAAAQARTGSPAPFEGRTGAIGDDHLPFVEAEVPAVDLIDLDYGPGPMPGRWWHTPQDTLGKVCAESLDAVGEAALAAIPAIRGE